MSWAIIADSSCNLRDYTPQAPNTLYAYAPLKINVGGTEYSDDGNLDVAELNRRVTEEKSASTSACPSAGEWAELFRSAENVIAITISANLSGSFEAASMARDLVQEEGGHRIHLVNSRAAGGKLEMLDILLDRNLTVHPEATFEEACAYIDGIEQCSTVLFSLSSYENLTKSGRMPKMAGILAACSARHRTRAPSRSSHPRADRRRWWPRSSRPWRPTATRAVLYAWTMSTMRQAARRLPLPSPPNGPRPKS